MVMSMCCVGVFICGCVQQANSTVEVVDTSKEDNKVIVTDIEGRVVELAGPAKRVVDCTGLGGTRILIQLEAEGLVVGMTDHGYDALNANGPSSIVFHPTQAAAMDLDVSNISSIGGYNEPNVQSIMALEPDLILVGWGGKELADSLEAQTGIKAACIGRMDGRFDYDLYQIVGSLIGKEDRAQALIEYTKDKLSIVTDITDELSESDKKVSIYGCTLHYQRHLDPMVCMMLLIMQVQLMLLLLKMGLDYMKHPRNKLQSGSQIIFSYSLSARREQMAFIQKKL